MTRRPRPTMHGRDHAPDGPDPIPGLVLDGGGVDEVGIQYAVDNEGAWLDVGTSSHIPTSVYGTRFHADMGAVSNKAVGIEATGDATVNGLIVDATSSSGGATGIIGRAVADGTAVGVYGYAVDGVGVAAETETAIAMTVTGNNGNGIRVDLHGDDSTYALFIIGNPGNILKVTAGGQIYMRSAPIIGPF